MSDWFKAEFHAERAHQFYESGQWDKALAELKLALAVNPQQADWRLGMGLTLDALERFDEAIECFRQVLEIRGEDVQTMLLLGYDLIRTDRPAEAVQTLERVNTLDPDCEPGYCHRIMAYAQMGQHDQAEEMFYRARQVADECPNCYDNIAHSLASRGMVEKAVWCWQQAIKLDPHYPGAYANLARMHWHKAQPERAHQYFLQQLRDDPGDLETLVELGRLLVEMGRHAEAGEKFRRVLEMDPAVAEAHLHLGELAIFWGHLDAAQASLEMADRIDPERAGVHLCFAQIAQKRGQANQAMAHLRAELARQGRTPGQTLELARVLIELRQSEQVPDLLSPLLDDPQDPPLDGQRLASGLLYRGVARMLSADRAGGIADCLAALQHAPRHALAMYNLSLAYLEMGWLTRAGYWLRKATLLRPDDSQLRQLRYRLIRARLAQRLRKIAGVVRGSR